KPAATSTAASRAEQQELLSTPAAATPGDTASNANGFEWAQLESDDYKQYIANLRAFGVPEKVIRDIIIADVGKLYRPRFAALRPPKKPANTNFWERQNTWYGQYRDTTPEQRAQMKALQKEQAALIKELLGENVYEEMQKDSGQPDWTERMFGSIPKESREQVSEMFQNFQEQQTDIYAKADGMIDQDTQTELKALRKKFREELATVLTPEQVAEYELRTSDTANQMRYELSSFEPDEAEFRAIFEYKQAKEDFETAWGQEAPDNRPSAEKQKAVEDALAAALGTDRLKEYKMMDDWAYRNLLEAGVEKESVFKIADMKTEVEKAANMIRQDKTLTQEQRNEALKAIRKETEQAMAKLIGERRTKAYANQGGWWLRNISHTR
ncbi:MAG TPA: hypothetical protein PKA41_04120, partial [Verrucomicrobiota bacterium]|nr:hypothetical protein [Verrucomicrobiota bacterium]